MSTDERVPEPLTEEEIKRIAENRGTVSASERGMQSDKEFGKWAKRTEEEIDDLERLLAKQLKYWRAKGRREADVNAEVSHTW